MSISILVLKAFLEQKQKSLSIHSKALTDFSKEESKRKQYVVGILVSEIKELKEAIEILEQKFGTRQEDEIVGNYKNNS